MKEQIQKSINDFSLQSPTQSAISLLNTLGYKASPNHLPEKTPEGFQDMFPDDRFSPERAHTAEWEYIDLLFQLTSEDLSKTFSQKEINRYEANSYIFFVLKLSSPAYNRTTLAKITREINKIFPMPAMIIFQYGETITLSIINRRLHKKDPTKDVLEKVILIKDININKPHRAHIEILYDLSLSNLKDINSWKDLHEVWEKILNTEKLNKRFYNELSNWYFWASDKVSFPNDLGAKEDVHISESLIRLLTRIIFIWFIKEMNLIPNEIFLPDKITGIIRGFNQPDSHVYYRAILQNLFFATLNQKQEERAFASHGTFAQNIKHYGIKTLYRYSSDFCISEKDVINLFKNVPFINGGLFDCLDVNDRNGKVLYIDGFSRKINKQAIVPDLLFFSKEIRVDLTKHYGKDNKNNEIVKGLFNIFNNYRFTVEENTPIDEEIALDPELLGRVFENLLASYNPETKKTARKQTGSFYTPRPVVDYIVDESLKAYLKNTLISEAKIDPAEADIGLEFLLGYYEKENLFNEKQTLILIKAIDSCKILDPACGSGAFPMGILHKMVHILKKLDPHNYKWKEQQIGKIEELMEKSNNISDIEVRQKFREDLNKSLDDIKELFENNELDYGRKLYLIENCIYGVDIQPIAIQISKLRFLISLIIDQKLCYNKLNYGIRPLPNLETKFVAANTLIGIDVTQRQGILGVLSNQENLLIEELNNKLQDIRKKMFSPKTSKEKHYLRKNYESVRNKLASILTKHNINTNLAKQLVNWNPYDQNASASYFDKDWMFGIKKGFDIIIGNPPYGNLLSNSEKKHIKKYYHHSTTSEIASPFLEKAIELLKNDGILSYIITFAITFSKSFSQNREQIYKSFLETFIYSFDRDKCRIFENMSQTVSIIKCFHKNPKEKFGISTSRMFRETPELRQINTSKADNFLLPSYEKPYLAEHRLPKIGEAINADILKKLLLFDDKVKDFLQSNNSQNHSIWIRTSGNYWYNAWDVRPYISSEIKQIYLKYFSLDLILLIMNSSLFYFWFRIYGDGRHMNIDILQAMPVPDKSSIIKYSQLISSLRKMLMKELFAVFDKSGNRFLTSKIKGTLDIIDLAICRFLYKLQYKHILHIMNYDSKVRKGVQLIDTVHNNVQKVIEIEGDQNRYNKDIQTQINNLDDRILGDISEYINHKLNAENL